MLIFSLKLNFVKVDWTVPKQLYIFEIGQLMGESEDFQVQTNFLE